MSSVVYDAPTFFSTLAAALRTFSSSSCLAAMSAGAAPTAPARRTFFGAGKKWRAHYADRNAYRATQGKLQREQLAKGGAHLAQIFKTIWP
jgi:hypothetical protein